MLRTICLAAALTALHANAFAQGASSPQCAYAPDYLAAQLGQSFAPGVPEAGLLGKGCRYDGKTVKLWVDAGPNPAPSVEAYRKMSNPPGTSWKPVPGDADQAVHTIPRSDVSPFPSLSYARNGWLVNLTVTGVDKASIDAWNTKLVKLKRFP